MATQTVQRYDSLSLWELTNYTALEIGRTQRLQHWLKAYTFETNEDRSVFNVSYNIVTEQKRVDNIPLPWKVVTENDCRLENLEIKGFTMNFYENQLVDVPRIEVKQAAKLLYVNLSVPRGRKDEIAVRVQRKLPIEEQELVNQLKQAIPAVYGGQLTLIDGVSL